MRKSKANTKPVTQLSHETSALLRALRRGGFLGYSECDDLDIAASLAMGAAIDRGADVWDAIRALMPYARELAGDGCQSALRRMARIAKMIERLEAGAMRADPADEKVLGLIAACAGLVDEDAAELLRAAHVYRMHLDTSGEATAVFESRDVLERACTKMAQAACLRSKYGNPTYAHDFVARLQAELATLSTKRVKAA